MLNDEERSHSFRLNRMSASLLAKSAGWPDILMAAASFVIGHSKFVICVLHRSVGPCIISRGHELPAHSRKTEADRREN